MDKQFSLHNKKTTPFYSPFAESKTVQRLIELFVVLMIVAYAFEAFWRPERFWQIATGAIGICVLIFSIITGKLFRYIEVKLFLLFLLIAWISSIFNFGVKASYFVTRFHCFWMVFLALYMVLYIAPEPSHVMHVFACTTAICFSVVCAFVTVHATRSLLSETPELRTVLGCFRTERLCGLGNENILGFMCASLLLISVYGFLVTKKHIRILYLFSAALGWFTLGLAGSRTSMVGVGSAIGLTICSSIFLKIGVRKNWHTALRLIVALAVGVFCGAVLLVSFNLPKMIFWGIIQGLHLVTHIPNTSQDSSSASSYTISTSTNSMSIRVSIWVKCIKDSFSSVRRALFGISPLSTEGMTGFIDGQPERTQPHAHNVYLDTIRRFGLLGLAPWIGQIIIWIRHGADILFKGKYDTSDRFLISCVIGFLFMGFTEVVPFSDITGSYIAIPFFIIIGYCMRKVREKV